MISPILIPQIMGLVGFFIVHFKCLIIVVNKLG